ncbi:MAG: zinc-dependent alcohol dehydrogenase [Cyclobacteriaceae bacterium]
MDKPLALWHLSEKHSALQEAEVPYHPEADCLVRASYSLVSTGTERLVARGQVPDSLQPYMSVPYMQGSFSFPIKYGYSLAGEVAEGPAELQGKKVQLLHPHQQWCRVPARELTIIPEKVPPLRASLASNLETALNAVWDSGVTVGDSVLLVGFGIIGSLLARLLSGIKGLDLQIYDKDLNRNELAEKMGFRLADQPHQHFDLAFHCSGSSEGLQLCLDHTAFESKVIELSWYGQQQVGIQLGGSFHYQRKQIVSSQVSHVSGRQRSRWDYQRRKALVMALLEDSAYDQHISEVIEFADSPALFDKIRKGDNSALSWAIRY